MKKVGIIVLLCTVLLFPIHSIAENVLGNTGSSAIQVKTSFNIPDQWQLQYINVRFCDEELRNTTKKDIISIRPWQTKEICTVFYNTSSGDSINISSSFVDAEKGIDGKFVCSMWSNTGRSLVSLLYYNTKEYDFTLTPKTTIIKKAKITIPKNMTWNLYGCVWYQLNLKKPDGYTGLFFVVERKVGVMEVNITWDVYNFAQRDNIKYIYKDNQLFILKCIAGILIILFIYYTTMATKENKKKKQYNKNSHN